MSAAFDTTMIRADATVARVTSRIARLRREIFLARASYFAGITLMITLGVLAPIAVSTESDSAIVLSIALSIVTGLLQHFGMSTPWRRRVAAQLTLTAAWDHWLIAREVAIALSQRDERAAAASLLTACELLLRATTDAERALEDSISESLTANERPVPQATLLAVPADSIEREPAEALRAEGAREEDRSAEKA